MINNRKLFMFLLILLLMAGLLNSTLLPVLAQEAEETPTPFSPEDGFIAPGRYRYLFETDNGLTRIAVIDVPSAAFEADAQVPLVFVLHGATSSGTIIARRTGLGVIAEREGFVAVYPYGLNGVWNDGRIGDSRVGDSDDTAYLLALADALAGELPLDPEATFAMGYSMGGMMSIHLACNAGGRIRAVASVASTMPTYLESECQTAAPLSILFVNGTADGVITFEGDRPGYLSASDSIAYWAEHNQCRTVVEPYRLPNVNLDDGVEPARVDVSDCEGGARVSMLALLGGGHTWPGHPFALQLNLGPVSLDLDAGEVIWSFFAQE